MANYISIDAINEELDRYCPKHLTQSDRDWIRNKIHEYVHQMNLFVHDNAIRAIKNHTGEECCREEVLIRLLTGVPISPLEDNEDEWENSGIPGFLQHIRYGRLLKTVNCPEKKGAYRFIKYEINSPNRKYLQSVRETLPLDVAWDDPIIRCEYQDDTLMTLQRVTVCGQMGQEVLAERTVLPETVESYNYTHDVPLVCKVFHEDDIVPDNLDVEAIEHALNHGVEYLPGKEYIETLLANAPILMSLGGQWLPSKVVDVDGNVIPGKHAIRRNEEHMLYLDLMLCCDDAGKPLHWTLGDDYVGEMVKHAKQGTVFVR